MFLLLSCLQVSSFHRVSSTVVSFINPMSQAIPIKMVCYMGGYYYGYDIVFSLGPLEDWCVRFLCFLWRLFQAASSTFHVTSGSALETLFGQYKYAAGGKLDASNYATARAACLVRNIVTPHHRGKDYRDISLNSTATPLEKKKYNHTKKQ
jgi:hypothetical protein